MLYWSRTRKLNVPYINLTSCLPEIVCLSNLIAYKQLDTWQKVNGSFECGKLYIHLDETKVRKLSHLKMFDVDKESEYKNYWDRLVRLDNISPET